MILFRSAMKRTVSAALCLLIFLSIGFLFHQPVKAETSFVFSATEVSGGNFKVTVGFPAVKWGSFDLSVQFDSSVVQMSGAATKKAGDEYEVSWQRSALDTANTAGEYSVVGAGDALTDMTNSGLVITFPFMVKSSTAATTTIKLIVNEFVDPSTADISVTRSVSKSVTLKSQSSVTPPPSSNTESDTSSNTSSTTDTPSDTSTPTSTKTDISTPTNTGTTSAKPSTKPSVSTSTKTDTDTGTQSDTVTDSETLTDTETNFPISNTATGTDINVTDVTDTQTDKNSGGWFSTVITATQEKPENRIFLSTGTIALISIGIAVAFCGALTAMGLLRRKKDTENQ